MTTRAGVTSKSGTLTGTVYVRPGADRCVIEVVEDEVRSHSDILTHAKNSAGHLGEG